jgi:hypothetical protein
VAGVFFKAGCGAGFFFVGALRGWICVVMSPVDIYAVSVVGSVDVDR